MPQLERTRRIWIYLPADYAATRQRYPVLYMHDGQNLFDEQTSFSGEWGVDEILDGKRAACIVVGIDNGGIKRMTEYNPNDNPQQGKGEGKAYLEFVVKTLKPYIDKHYRTLKTKGSTAIAGSSMGGLISFYAGLYYPTVFGSVGVLSPSFWIVPQLKTELVQFTKKKYRGQRYFFYAGGRESSNMVTDMQQIAEWMDQHSPVTVKVSVLEEGQHNESSWGKIFPAFYDWTIGQ
ncbi:MAG: alpha/beta hydrolase [Williamsia sp.]|nr:alpha/beta hydrolase [Williamsia sp.]